MSGFDVLVLGDANPDLVLRGGQVVPAFGQAERLVHEARLTIGGSGAIFACGAARLGLSIAFVGVVGDDVFGRFMLDELRSRGIDVGGTVVDPDRPTGLTVVLSLPHDRAMLTAPGTVGSLNAAVVDRDLLASARHVHVSSYYLQRDLRPGLRRLLAAVRVRGGTTSVDPNYDPSGRWGDELFELLPQVDVFLPNEMEALSLARISDLDRAIARLRNAGAETVVVKLAGNGAVGAGPGATARAGGIRVEALDSTGAGDSFNAGFLAGWLRGESLDRALALGNACGALSTLGTGGTANQPTLEEAVTFLERGAA
jgi:sugar/nucleoside kinase (ribokinase family)